MQQSRGLEAGLLAPGRAFDALAVAVEPASHDDGWDRAFERLVSGGATNELTRVWVDGREGARR